MGFFRRALSFSLIFFLFLGFVFSEEESSAEKSLSSDESPDLVESPSGELASAEGPALPSLEELFFDVGRFNLTGLASFPETSLLAPISKEATNIMLHKKYSPAFNNSIYLLEYYFPEKIGIIDSTLSPEDLASVSESEPAENFSFDWIDMILRSLDAKSSPSGSEPFDVTDGSKILEILEGGDNRGIDAPDDGKTEEELPQEYTYTKEGGALRRFSYDGEQFTAWQEGDFTVLVNYYGDRLIRKYYDSLFRLSKTERFKTAATAKKINLENETEYEYLNDSYTPEKSVENLLSVKKRRENHFDENGRVISVLESHYEEREKKSKSKKKDEKNEKEEVLLNDRKTSRKYDGEGRVTEEEILTWSYKKLLSGRYSTSERSVKNVYDYSAVTESNNLPPDLKFYEDGELHLERKYKTSDTYSEKLYFDSDFSVEVIYEGGIKKTEIIYLGGIEKRRRNFEY